MLEKTDVFILKNGREEAGRNSLVQNSLFYEKITTCYISIFLLNRNKVMATRTFSVCTVSLL